MKKAYFTVASNDYVPGAYCLAKSLMKVGGSNLNVIGIDISNENKCLLKSIGCEVIDTEYLGSKTCKPQKYRDNPNFANNCYNKIHLWNQPFEKIIYFDADVIVVKNVDHLFDLQHEFAAGSSFQTTFCTKTGRALKAGWRGDYFNSGVMVLTPSSKTYKELLVAKDTVETPKDPSDQGLLNRYFENKWHRLKPIYNFTRRVFDVAPYKYHELKNDICILHFTLEKPWKERNNTEINKIWWEINDSSLFKDQSVS